MLINCETISKRIREEVKNNIAALELQPTLALIRVLGDDASEIYVRNKVRACEEVGIKSIVIELPEDTTEEALGARIDKLNNDNTINGILVQLPLPSNIGKNVIEKIHPLKDVDCLTDFSIGKLFGEGEDIVSPCTPKGIMRIIKDTVISISGVRVLVINRSMLVGKPLIELLQREDATVTLAHSKTGIETIKALMALSDLIIVGVGIPNFINKEIVESFEGMRKVLKLPPQVFIDVSMNRDENGKLCGDVSKDLYENENMHITPVPKGVGLTTVSSLLSNTVELAYIQTTIKKNN